MEFIRHFRDLPLGLRDHPPVPLPPNFAATTDWDAWSSAANAEHEGCIFRPECAGENHAG